MKRILLSLATVGALSALITGATFALFTAQTENLNNTFSAGTVSLGNVALGACDIGDPDNLAPGDSGSCTVEVTYSGSLEAFIGVQFSTEGALFGGLHPVSVSLTGGEGNHKGYYLLGKYDDGDKAEVTVDWSFPIDAGNDYQGASGTVNLKFVAVQARNNTETAPGGFEAPISWN